MCSAKDLMKYARFHLGDGLLPNGNRLMGGTHIKTLHTPLLHATGLKNVALSWFVSPLGDKTMLSHNGGTNGQQTFLYLAPEHKFALIILTNGDRGAAAASAIYQRAIKEFLALPKTETDHILMPSNAVAEYLGRYTLPSTEFKIFKKKSQLIAQLIDKGGFPTPKDRPEQQPPPSRIAFWAHDKIEMLDQPYKGNRGEFLRDEKGGLDICGFSRGYM